MNSPIRLLIIDDSSYNRKTIAGFFVGIPDVTVVGRAADGQEGLQMVLTEKPTVITLDLEMPRLDGFSFLRLLMSSRPTPVVVISSYANPDNAFRALELGATDFVMKPGVRVSEDIQEIRNSVIHKVLSAGRCNIEALRRISSSAPATGAMVLPRPDSDRTPFTPPQPAEKLILMGASTGGPAALSTILQALPADLGAAIVVSQHMHARFLSTFIQRLNRRCALEVIGVSTSDILKNGTVYVAPGNGDLVFSRTLDDIRVTQVPSEPKCPYTPSINRMLLSAADLVGENLLAVILTGMGDDGAEGCSAVYARGGSVLVEHEESAVVNGMPSAVLRQEITARQRPLHLIASALGAFANRPGSSLTQRTETP